jgi:hypothetical protein
VFVLWTDSKGMSAMDLVVADDQPAEDACQRCLGKRPTLVLLDADPEYDRSRSDADVRVRMAYLRGRGVLTHRA